MWVGVASIVSAIVAILGFLHLIMKERKPLWPAEGGDGTSSMLTAYTIVVLIGVFAAISRQLISLFLITIIGLDNKFSADALIYRGQYIVIPISIIVFSLVAAGVADFYARRYRPRSETLSALAFWLAGASFFATTLLANEQVYTWWVSEFPPLP